MAITTTRWPTASIAAGGDRPTAPDGGVLGGSLFWEDSSTLPTNGFSLYMAGRGTSARTWINILATGTGTLAGAATVIADTRITADSKVYVQRRTQGAAPGFLSVTVAAGVGFTITSSGGALDDSKIWYWITG